MTDSEKMTSRFRTVDLAYIALFAVLMIAGCVTLVVLIVILAVASHRARIQRQLRMAEEKVKRQESAGKARSSGRRSAKPDAKKTDKDGK